MKSNLHPTQLLILQILNDNKRKMYNLHSLPVEFEYLPFSVREISDAIGCSTKTVRNHFKALSEKKLVNVNLGQALQKEYSISDAGKTMLNEVHSQQIEQSTFNMSQSELHRTTVLGLCSRHLAELHPDDIEWVKANLQEAIDKWL